MMILNSELLDVVDGLTKESNTTKALIMDAIAATPNTLTKSEPIHLLFERVAKLIEMDTKENCSVTEIGHMTMKDPEFKGYVYKIKFRAYFQAEYEDETLNSFNKLWTCYKDVVTFLTFKTKKAKSKYPELIQKAIDMYPLKETTFIESTFIFRLKGQKDEQGFGI